MNRWRMLRSERYPDGRLQVYVEPRDGWVGVYDDNENMYVLPAPLLVVRWSGDPHALCLAMTVATALVAFATLPLSPWIVAYPLWLTLSAYFQYWRRVTRHRPEQPNLGNWRTRPLRPADVDPNTLIAALCDDGWRPIGRRTGAYTRFQWPNDGRRSLFVPEDRTAPEHEQMMRGTLTELAQAADLGVRTDRVLSVLAGGQPEPDPDEPTDLEHAIFVVWLEGNWQWVTRKMGSDEREAAVNAVLRYSAWLNRDDPDEEPTPREHVAWWEA